MYRYFNRERISGTHRRSKGYLQLPGMISRSRTTIQQQPYTQNRYNLTLPLLHTYHDIYLNLVFLFCTWMPLYRVVLLVAFRVWFL